jgi:HSP20 family molecular chaperone IbpA
MDTKVLVIDTEKVDLAALSKVLGVDLQAEIDKALGRECEGCECDEVEAEEKFDEEFGNIEVEDDNTIRYKIGFKVTDATDVTVTEEDGGVEVTAFGPNGEEFIEFVECADAFDPRATTVNLRNGVLTIRFYKVRQLKTELGRSITVNKW